MRCIALLHTCMRRRQGNTSTVLLRHPAGVPRDRYPGSPRSGGSCPAMPSANPSQYKSIYNLSCDVRPLIVWLTLHVISNIQKILISVFPLPLSCVTTDDVIKWNQSQSQSQSYVNTDGQSASLSWNKEPIWGLRSDIYYCLTVTGFLMWGALSDERTGLSFARVTVRSSKSFVRMYNLHSICY
jgi:hypothetical protein